jgi:hypothetical protein
VLFERAYDLRYASAQRSFALHHILFSEDVRHFISGNFQIDAFETFEKGDGFAVEYVAPRLGEPELLIDDDPHLLEMSKVRLIGSRESAEDLMILEDHGAGRPEHMCGFVEEHLGDQRDD